MQHSLRFSSILRMCYQANVREQAENAEVSNLDNEKQVITM
ncbi:hypothetical protein [Rickettsia montanensis]|uniref:Uncharacterized protein n=1 Tax=Rickettsia montanensis (strain OSU 85-930) TaxID=1105114 RepID=H8KBP6_RICMS|nr:hypothetical protein [Rickettsia montanensis]AFC73308.1 hypothetical protein MCI_01860 [Rickettsia montanensis str. OSU 85-930]